MPLFVQMLEEDESNGTTNRGITSVLAQHAAPSPLEENIAVPSEAVNEESCAPSSQTVCGVEFCGMPHPLHRHRSFICFGRDVLHFSGGGGRL